MPIEPARLELLSALARKVLWLSSWTIHHANHIRPNADGGTRLRIVHGLLGVRPAQRTPPAANSNWPCLMRAA